MAVKIVGGGSQYAMATVDAEGNYLDGGKTYCLHLPPNIPVNNFWSLIPYDTQTRSVLQTDQRDTALTSESGTVQANADGSVDMYFGPEAPAGKESNWIQTVPGKGWFTMLRLYGRARALVRQDVASGGNQVIALRRESGLWGALDDRLHCLGGGRPFSQKAIQVSCSCWHPS